MERVEAILDYWFGRIERTGLPTENRVRIWFQGGAEVDKEIREKFGQDLYKAIDGEYDSWEEQPRSALALIILFDQFSRHVYRDTPNAYAQDQRALEVCLKGIERQHDHALSLIERAFFYIPLMHAENIEMQATAVQAFKMLSDLAFTETRPMFASFLEYAIKHYEAIKKFGRFPHRNEALGRASMPDELEYLKIQGTSW